MDLNGFNTEDLEAYLPQSRVLSNFLKTFINELKEYFEKSNTKDDVDVIQENKYNNYWGYQHFMEDNVAAQLGLSRWSADFTYYKELSEAVDDSILEITKKEGVILYRNQFPPNGSTDGLVYNIEKFENGEITHIKISKDDIPKEFQDEDIIFQYDKNGNIVVRTDLKEEVVKLTTEKLVNLKEEENERNDDYKQEGHIYEVIEDDGYIFLNDITEERGFIIEDIDFVVDSYQGDGMYQVINDKYEKL